MRAIIFFLTIAVLSGCTAGADPVVQSVRLFQVPTVTYPPNAKRNGAQGKVVVEVEVLSSGDIGARNIKKSSGDRELDQAALDASGHLRLMPARTRSGQPVTSTTDVPFAFELAPLDFVDPSKDWNASEAASYAAKVDAAVRPNIVSPHPLRGNPVCVVLVTLATDGRIVESKVIKASRAPAWDAAVLRALSRTASLPLDTSGRVPSKIEIRFRPYS